jgi:hypothetical protein
MLRRGCCCGPVADEMRTCASVDVLVRPPGARDFILHVVCHVCSSLAGIRSRTHVVVLALSTCDWVSTEVEICS